MKCFCYSSHVSCSCGLINAKETVFFSLCTFISYRINTYTTHGSSVILTDILKLYLLLTLLILNTLLITRL